MSLIAIFLHMSSCKQGDQGADGAEELSAQADAGSVMLSREQFESSGMSMGLPSPRTFSNSVSSSGYVVASLKGGAEISTLISGRVKQINFSTGDFVPKNDVLFLLESSEIILLQQAYAEAFQNLKLLQADYERLKALSEERIVAEKDFLKAESDYRSLQATAEGLKARLVMIHINPSEVEGGTIVPYMSVKSPISGSITRQDLMLGQYIELNETPIEIINTNLLRLKLRVFENSMAELQTGQKVLFYTPDNPERIFEATLSKIGKEVSTASRSVECYAEINPQTHTSFLNRMYVEAEIVTCERVAHALPEQALVREPDMDYVLQLVEEEDDQLTFRKVPVQTGVTRQGFTEILDADVSTVLIDGVYNLWTE
jgi:cobalt-zinc-cadmium efflux system membrane fusion protein